MSTILRTVGIDISKDWLDAFAAPEGRAARFPNDRAGLRKLIAWIGSGVDRIAYEPTGAFHRDFEETHLKAGLPLYAINPFQVRSFARSIGRRAKTDAADARMLATMATAIEDLRPTQARSEGQRDLAELQQVRDALRKDRVATTNRQPRRTRPGHPGVRTLEGTQLHPGRQAPGPQAALHARAGRGPAQSRPEA